MPRLRSRALAHLRATTVHISLQLPACAHARYAPHAALHMHIRGAAHHITNARTLHADVQD
eukprot:2622712-Pleurochrysis_carterae.AAC.1